MYWLPISQVTLVSQFLFTNQHCPKPVDSIAQKNLLHVNQILFSTTTNKKQKKAVWLHMSKLTQARLQKPLYTGKLFKMQG